MVNAVGSDLVRNRQNSGGQRTGQEYMNNTMYAWLTGQVLAWEARTWLIDIWEWSSVNEMILSTIQLHLLGVDTNWLDVASICNTGLREARFGIRRVRRVWFVFVFSHIFFSLKDFYLPFFPYMCRVGVIESDEKCKSVVGCLLAG